MSTLDHSVIFPLLAIIILCALAVVIGAYANRG